MKKLLLFVIIMATIAFGSVVYADIIGSAHDFSNETWNQTGEICVVCHAPHPSQTQVNDAPLWNHEITTATFTPYSSSTMDATVGQPDGASKLCLSCHDGTVALDSFNGAAGGQYISGNDLIGTDLSNDHPVSIVYDSSLASTDGGLFDPSTTSSGLGGTINSDMLFNSKLQCSSCHDVHNSTNIGKLLVKSNSNSALCLTCHNK